MKRSIAELITRDPEKFAHHDRVFKITPLLCRAWVWLRWWCLPPQAKML